MFVDWDTFIQRAEEIYRNDPLKTRYCCKYNHSDASLVLKVTDDRTCLQYKTDQAADVRKLEKLQYMFFTLMACGPEADLQQAEQAAQLQQQLAAPAPKKNRRRG